MKCRPNKLPSVSVAKVRMGILPFSPMFRTHRPHPTASELSAFEDQVPGQQAPSVRCQKRLHRIAWLVPSLEHKSQTSHGIACHLISLVQFEVILAVQTVAGFRPFPSLQVANVQRSRSLHRDCPHRLCNSHRVAQSSLQRGRQ